MTHDDITAIKIENVSEIESVTGATEILFHIEGCAFRFIIFDTDKKYYFGSIYHESNSKMCLFCYEIWENQLECNILGNQEIKQLLFERLIESKSIRLNWLYRQPRKK